MGRGMSTSAFAFLLISALAFAAAPYLGSEWNWAPAHLPAPGAGLSVEMPFEIATGGKFHVEAGIPTRSREVAVGDRSAIACRLDVSIDSDDSSKSHKFTITEFRLGGRGALDIYDSRPEVTLGRGRYVLVIRNAASVNSFASTGGMLTFTRFVHPTEYYLQGVLLRGLAWCGLVAGIVAALSAVRAKAA